MVQLKDDRVQVVPVHLLGCPFNLTSQPKVHATDEEHGSASLLSLKGGQCHQMIEFR